MEKSILEMEKSEILMVDVILESKKRGKSERHDDYNQIIKNWNESGWNEASLVYENYKNPEYINMKNLCINMAYVVSISKVLEDIFRPKIEIPEKVAPKRQEPPQEISIENTRIIEPIVPVVAQEEKVEVIVDVPVGKSTVFKPRVTMVRPKLIDVDARQPRDSTEMKELDSPGVQKSSVVDMNGDSGVVKKKPDLPERNARVRVPKIEFSMLAEKGIAQTPKEDVVEAKDVMHDPVNNVESVERDAINLDTSVPKRMKINLGAQFNEKYKIGKQDSVNVQPVAKGNEIVVYLTPLYGKIKVDIRGPGMAVRSDTVKLVNQFDLPLLSARNAEERGLPHVMLQSEKQLAIEEHVKSEKERKLKEARTFTTMRDNRGTMDFSFYNSIPNVISSPRLSGPPDLHVTPKYPNTEKFVKITPEFYNNMITLQGVSLPQLFRRNNKALLIFMPSFGTSTWHSLIEDIYTFQQGMLQLNTFPILVLSDYKRAESYFVKLGLKYKRIHILDDSQTLVRKAFKLDGVYSMGGLLSGKGLKGELQAAFLIENGTIIHESRPKFLIDNMDFMRMILMPELVFKDSKIDRYLYNLSSNYSTKDWDVFDRQEILTASKYSHQLSPRYRGIFSRDDHSITVHDVLDSVSWIGFFRVYMGMSLRLSALLFYEHVTYVYKTSLELPRRLEIAREIMRTFLNETSVYYVSECRLVERFKENIKNKLEADEAEVGLFDTCLQVVINGPIKESFEKYKLSPLFSDMKRVHSDNWEIKKSMMKNKLNKEVKK